MKTQAPNCSCTLLPCLASWLSPLVTGAHLLMAKAAVEIGQGDVVTATADSLAPASASVRDPRTSLRCILARHPPAMALKAALDRCPPAPNENTDQDLHWLAHRIPCQRAVHNSFQYRVVQHHCPDRRPESPRPTAHLYESVSKRKWENMALKWRALLVELAAEIVERMNAVATVRWLGGPELYPGYIQSIPQRDMQFP